jgi:hypothetical protein
MELDMDPRRIVDTAIGMHASTPDGTLPSPSQTPIPPAPPLDIAIASPSDVVARPPRSVVWAHFIKADDYETSNKATCMHCGKTLVASGGSTSTMRQHLKNRHVDKLNETLTSLDK